MQTDDNFVAFDGRWTQFRFGGVFDHNVMHEARIVWRDMESAAHFVQRANNDIGGALDNFGDPATRFIASGRPAMAALVGPMIELQSHGVAMECVGGVLGGDLHHLRRIGVITSVDNDEG